MNPMIAKLLRDAQATGRGFVGNTLPNLAGGGVDLINAGLGLAGVPTSQAPVGGSEWIKRQLDAAGLRPQMTGDPLEELGGILGGGFAPGMARGLGRAAFRAEENARQPASASATALGRQAGAVGPVDRKTAQQILDAVREPDGGATIGLGGQSPAGGFAVATNPAKAMVRPADQLTVDDIAQWIDKQRGVLQTPDTHIGAWHSPDTKQVYIEPSTVVPNRNKAMALAEMVPNQKGKVGSQEAIFNLNDFKTESLKMPKLGARAQQLGNQIQSAPTQRRLDELFEQGMELNQKHFGGKDWWPMRGTEIEKTYGTRGAQQWADLFGITAPNASVPANIAMANRAMARSIRGEPYGKISLPSVNQTLENYGAGKYWDTNRMAGSPKITEMTQAPFYDAPVIDDLRIGQGIFGVNKLNRSEHAVVRDEMAGRAGKYNASTGNEMPTAEYLARIWQAVRPDAPVNQQAPMDNAFIQRMIRNSEKTPAALKKEFDAEGNIGKVYKQLFGRDIDRKLTFDEIRALMGRGAMWGVGGMAALPGREQTD